MRNFPIVGGLLMFAVCASTASATLMCVPSAFSTIDQVQAAQTSCIVNNNEQFNHFTFSSSAMGTTALNPADVGFQILQGIGVEGPYLIFPQTFTVSSPPSGTDVSSSFTLAYSVSALNNMVITSFDGHLIGTAAHNGSSSISISYCAGAPVSACPAGQGGVIDVNSIASIKTVTFPSGVASLNFLVTGRIDSPDQGSSAAMTSFEVGVQPGPGSGGGGAGSGVPEPATGLLLSLGIILFGGIHLLRARKLP